MTITVNGTDRQVDPATTVGQLVKELAGDGASTAVAVNDTVVPRGSWPAVALSAGDRVEILSPTAGG